MRKLKAIIWAIWVVFKSPFVKKVDFKEEQVKMDRQFGFIGSNKKPFKNAKLYEHDKIQLTVREAIVLKGERGENRAFLKPGNQVVWSLNLNGAKRKFRKQGYDVLD